jgi:hypothetical protein
MSSMNGNSRVFGSTRIGAARAGLAATIAALALSCGEYFPNAFLTTGDEIVLKAAPFGFSTLVAPHVPAKVGTLVPLAKANYAFVDRQSDDGADLEAARATPGALLTEFELYQQGRACFLANDEAGARAAWERILALPRAERQWRSTWAAYMLGRSWHAQDPARASEQYAQTRELAAEGFADTLGLATASIGWEARLAYEKQDLPRAFALYLEQAAAKDPTATMSLWRCCNKVYALDDAALEELVRAPRCRAIVTAWLVSENRFESELVNPVVVRPAGLASRWIAALENAGATEVPFADIIAWSAYQSGQYEVARRWAARAGAAAPRAGWITAKLALREGRVDEAAALLAKAVRAMPPADPWYSLSEDGRPDAPADRDLASGEAGVLLLTVRQYAEALDFFMLGGHWIEAAYVAERVLTTEELVAEVDGRAQRPQASGIDEFAREREQQLRALLGRRLAREGDYARAKRYLPAAIAPLLLRLEACLAEGRSPARAAVERAAALTEAARIMRHRGMELMGTELGPDNARTNGAFWAEDLLADRKQAAEARMVTLQEDESRRAAATAVTPWRRFHYRYLASDLAWEAAALLPDGEQRTAALLCEAGLWLKDRDTEAADRFYKAMVRRCGATPLGIEADKLRWFPTLADKDLTFTDRIVQALPEDERPFEE